MTREMVLESLLSVLIERVGLTDVDKAEVSKRASVDGEFFVDQRFVDRLFSGPDVQSRERWGNPPARSAQ